MNIVTEVSACAALRNKLANKTVGFVPTMGHLHPGHLALCKQSQSQNDVTIVSIFVNQPQFNQAADFDAYPRTLDQDTQLLTDAGIDYLFLPTAEAMYPDRYDIQVTETSISKTLEGEHRPGHYNGMLTIVLKFLNLLQPTRTYFGEKDYQQLLLVRKMVSALFIPTEIIGCETIRANDNLALSSRNTRLNDAQRVLAAKFPALLNSGLDLQIITEQLASAGFKIDYIADAWQRRLGAVWLDNIRLIDNFPHN